jgi:hypothetical protein
MRTTLVALLSAAPTSRATRTLGLFAAAALVGCADAPTGAAPEAAPPPSALIGAEPTGDRFGNVALMVGRSGPGAPWGPVCTGTLIAPDVVLTAGHCVLLARLFERYSEFGVTFAPEFSPAASVVSAGAHVHPDFFFPFATPEDPYDAFDLAVLVLETESDLVPAQLPPPGLLDHIGRSAGPLTVVGYGIPRADAGAAARGTRRVGQVRLDEVFAPLFSTTPDAAVGCIGDSGGPIFRGAPQGGQAGVTMLLGIAHNTDCRTWMAFYRLDTPQARGFLGAFVDLPH